MDNRLTEFYSLISAKYKIKKSDAEKAAQILYEWFEETKDIKALCVELLDAYWLVMEKFAEQYWSVMSEQEVVDFCREFTQLLRTIKLGKSTLSCGFVLVAGAYKVNKLNADVLSVLKMVVSRAEQKAAFSDIRCKEFKKNLVEPTGAKFLAADYSSWSTSELARLDNYLSAALPDLADLIYRECVYQWRITYNIAQPTTQQASVVGQNDNVIYAITPEMLAEFKTLYDNVFVKNNVFRELEENIALKEQLLQRLQRQTQELSEKIVLLEEQIADKEEQVQNLDARLRNVFNWEDGSRKQELLTLKKDIAASLKLTHNDYRALLDIPVSIDSYEFAKATIEDMFKTLKRYGIEL